MKIFNLYLFHSAANTPPTSTFPWMPEPRRVSLTHGITDINNGNGFHELGHTLGLYHTFGSDLAFRYPVTPGQADHPENFLGRELVLTAFDPLKEFTDPNNEDGGDLVKDTPPGCNQLANAANNPAPTSLSPGCFDNDPGTPCINYCQDNNSSTPCIGGCIFDMVNCNYNGSFIDYNLDPIVDQANILAKNYMSYTFNCRSQFTQDQKNRADLMASFFLNQYYQEDLCESLMDRVEVEDSGDGFRPVSVRITPVDDVTDYIQTVVQSNGDFIGKLSNSFG